MIRPENTEQSFIVKEFLNNLNVPFESQPDDLPVRVVQSIKRGLTDFKNNQTIPLKDFKEKHFSKNEL